MTIEELYMAVLDCRADTLMAYSFRKACGLPQPVRRGSIAAKTDRYRDVEKLMRQRYGVRM